MSGKGTSGDETSRGVEAGLQSGSGSFTNHNYYHADGNGNITYMVDTNQSMVASYRYDPFGNTISSSGTLSGVNVYQFSSKERHNNSGMYYYGYRWYDPNLQRWLNRDPLGESGFELVQRVAPLRSQPFIGFAAELVEDPNLYTYLANEPINRTDGEGLTALHCIGCLLAIHKASRLADQMCKRARDAYRNCLTDTPKSGSDADFDPDKAIRFKQMYDKCRLLVLKTALSPQCFACAWTPVVPLPRP